jgi:hypothetical protein
MQRRILTAGGLTGILTASSYLLYLVSAGLPF